MIRIGCMAVHYGKEYIARAVQGLAGSCDEVHVFYTATPSFGFADPNAVCPDTEDELVAEARKHAERVIWHHIDGVSSEGHHRSLMLEQASASGATVMAIADADEIWDSPTLTAAMNSIEHENRAGRWLARFHHFWRSWGWTISDAFRPVRLVDLRHPLDVDAYLDETMQPWPIYHFGYAQTLATMRYKFSCHGHFAEFRPGWFENKFLPWTPNGDHVDLHPCVNNLWTAVPTDERTLEILGMLMPDHPHRRLAIIE